MTEEQAIQQVEAALEAFESGSDDAIDRLTKALALLDLDTNIIAVGDVSGSSNIRIGNDILVELQRLELPPQLVTRLQQAADVLLAGETERWIPDQTIRIFVASPNDVREERGFVREAVDSIREDRRYKDYVNLKIIAWDKPGVDTPMPASMTPQEAISKGLGRPSECDIVLVIFWSKIGTPLSLDDYQKPEEYQFENDSGLPLNQYYSGTEWEYVDAMIAAKRSKRETGIAHPLVMVYRSDANPAEQLFDEDDNLRQKKDSNYRLLKAFFASFTAPDGSVRQNINFYEAPEAFRPKVETHLRNLIARIMDRRSAGEAPLRTESADRRSRASAWPMHKSPFPGLRAFAPADAPVFFGREWETNELIKRLKAASFIPVIGASGSGKSSLVGAGLIPKLAKNAIEGSRDWWLPDYHEEIKEWSGLRFTPGEVGDPFLGMALKLKAALGRPALEIAADLRSNPTGVGDLLDQALADRPSWAKALVFIDQFEELFTHFKYDEVKAVQADFVRLLDALAKAERTCVVVTMRSDFAGRCADFPNLNRLVMGDEGTTFWLSRPGYGALYEMITRPADAAGLRYEDNLNAGILEDTGSEPGALALTAYALRQLWQASRDRGDEDRWLLRKDYRSFNGVAGAIGTHADKAFASLEMDEALKYSTLRLVFSRLVSVTPREEGGYTATRQRAALNELRGASASPEARLIKVLTNERLLVTSRNEQTGEDELEVAHEALLRRWGMLDAWIQEAGEAMSLVEEVRQAARRWQESGEDRHLWPQEDMDKVWEVLDQHPYLEKKLEGDGGLYWRFLQDEYLRLEAELLAAPPDDDDREALQAFHRYRAEDIGNRLAEIGDPRPGVGLVHEGMKRLPGEGSAPMLSGAAPVGQPEYEETRLWGEKPEHDGLPDIVWLPVRGTGAFEMRDKGGEVVGTFPVPDLYIAKYPITYVQFQAFIKDDFSNPRWWEGLEADNEHRTKPRKPRWSVFNRPRETVSWYDAIAFCRWLNARLDAAEPGRWPDIPLDLTPQTLLEYPGVRLPTEWEWQWAATGGSPAYEYPWGPEWNGAKCNTTESGLSRTTAVGMYPQGVAPCGALDMSGNVWEWCLNEYDTPENTRLGGDALRVVRGGSWYGSGRLARAAYRSRFGPPLSRGNYFGFRVGVLLPS